LPEVRNADSLSASKTLNTSLKVIGDANAGRPRAPSFQTLPSLAYFVDLQSFLHAF
jgi:hypothetical protein